MFKVIFLLLSSIFVTESFAANMPTCKIVTLNDAKACMNKVAKAYPDYEQANEAMVSANSAALVKVLKALGLKDQSVKADFVGAMLEHGDEHHIYYFAMKKGNAKPIEVYDLNLVDLASSLVSSVTLKDLFLGTSFKGSDVKEDIQEAIKEFNTNN